MSNLAKTQPQGLVIHSIQDLNQVGKLLAQSGFFQDAKGEAQCAVKVLAGLEMGISAFAAMTGIHIVKGRLSAGANIMAMKVKSHPAYDYRVREMNNTACKIEFFQNGESIGISEFTIEDAKKAGTQNMDKFPRNMLFARCISNGIRWYCPDAMGPSPVYTPEELGVAVDGEGEILDVQSITVDGQDTRDWKTIISALDFTVDTLRETALANSLPASSKDLSPEQSEALLNAVMVRYGLESGVFKAYQHCVNSLAKVEESDDMARIEAWKAKIAAKSEPAPALD